MERGGWAGRDWTEWKKENCRQGIPKMKKNVWKGMQCARVCIHANVQVWMCACVHECAYVHECAHGGQRLLWLSALVL